jgi:hypothetical protein
VSSTIKVDRIQSDTGTVNLASNLAFSSAFSMSGPVTLNSPTIATPTMTGQAVIPSINLTGGQIVFPATQNPSAGANTLDDYEEGTWTPVIFGGTTAGTGTYSTQSGTYTKIGNAVTLYFSVNWSGHTGTGEMRISGLPFSASASNNATAAMYANNLTITGQAYAVVVGSQIFVFSVNNGAGAQLVMDAAASLQTSLTYFV